MTNYTTKTTMELISILGQFLTTEERKSIENMSTGLKLKIELLEDLKSNILRVNPNLQLDVLEHKLANALALTKSAYGSSLTLAKSGKLRCVEFIMSDKKGSDVDNFAFLAGFNAKEQSLEDMIMQSQLRKIVDLSESVLEHLDADLVLEVKRRITGVKKLDSSDDDMLKM